MYFYRRRARYALAPRHAPTISLMYDIVPPNIWRWLGELSIKKFPPSATSISPLGEIFRQLTKLRSMKGYDYLLEGDKGLEHR